MNFDLVATGLGFAEGPIAMPDGSVLFVDIRGGTLGRVERDGAVTTVARLGGGPNGAAMGPGNAVYVCNNGGMTWHDAGELAIPGHMPQDYQTGSIQRVDLATGAVTTLYTQCDGHPLRGPNDIVFDRHGGFWFTDFGKTQARTADKGFLHYALADGSRITRLPFAMYGPNGVGLSPDGTRLYVAESYTGRLLAWTVSGPGEVASPQPEVIDATRSHFDSLAVEESGRVVVAAITHGLCIVDPDGSGHEYVEMPDPFTTNVCFGGPDRTTAFVTLSGAGRLVTLDWPRPGLALAH